MSALRDGEDAAVAYGTDGSEDAVQRVRSEVQIRTTCAGVSTGFESDVRDGETLQFSPESDGAPTTEGDARRAFAESASA